MSSKTTYISEVLQTLGFNYDGTLTQTELPTPEKEVYKIIEKCYRKGKTIAETLTIVNRLIRINYFKLHTKL